jgi:very-short-patch-repair endonuclease
MDRPPARLLHKVTLDRSRRLRRDQTVAERKLWALLRHRSLAGLKFRRQYHIEKFIVDFCCVERSLVVELDGGQHGGDGGGDAGREAFLNSEGYQVIRFWNNEVLMQTEAVLSRLLDALAAAPSP